MSKFEKKFGRYAIPNLTLILILSYVAGYVIELLGSAAGVNLLGYLTLDPYRILHGQIWRLVTWVIVPPESLGIFTVIMLYFYYSLGTTLERTWGTYRYNVYIFSGMLFTIIGSFLCMGVVYLMYGSLPTEIASSYFYSGSYAFSTYYINLSIFLAFAATYPDMQVLLMFVIPVKMKWMGILDAVLMLAGNAVRILADRTDMSKKDETSGPRMDVHFRECEARRKCIIARGRCMNARRQSAKRGEMYYLKGEFLHEQRSIICQDLRGGPQDCQRAGKLHQRRTGKGSLRGA